MCVIYNEVHTSHVVYYLFTITFIILNFAICVCTKMMAICTLN